MSIAVLGAGAFGTALAIALSRDGARVTLWGRDAQDLSQMDATRKSGHRLPGFTLPDSLSVTSDVSAIDAETALLAIPTQGLAGFLEKHALRADILVACCKGIDRSTGRGPVALIEANRPDCVASVLTGPSFAADIAAGLPTALVLATHNNEHGEQIQSNLTRPMLRLYRTNDVVGAELGGALKNVIAIAAGISIGAGLGDSARASVVARGFSEMTRLAEALGARSETLHGLSGLGDLVLTCTSEKSRNFATGLRLGRGKPPDAITIEGMKTAEAVANEANRLGLELPVMQAVSNVVSGQLDISSAIATLLARPVGKE